MLEKSKCINCGAPCQSYNWFCAGCVTIKEKAYEISRKLNENYTQVIIRRDKALRKANNA